MCAVGGMFFVSCLFEDSFRVWDDAKAGRHAPIHSISPIHPAVNTSFPVVLIRNPGGLGRAVGGMFFDLCLLL